MSAAIPAGPAPPLLLRADERTSDIAPTRVDVTHVTNPHAMSGPNQGTR
jgi:hypothetical protein